jgi:hypothetical protein
MMHGVAFSLIAGKIGELANDVGKSLAGKRRDAAARITVTVTNTAIAASAKASNVRLNAPIRDESLNK